MMVWTPTVFECLICMCFLFLYLQLSMFHMEKRSRNALIIIIIVKYPRTSFLFYFVPKVCELTFSIKWTHYKTGTLWHLDAFILFASAAVVLDPRLQNTFSQSSATCVLLSLMSTPKHSFVNSCCLVGASFLSFLHSSSSCQFRATDSIKFKLAIYEDGQLPETFECKVDVHWCKKLFWPIRTGHTVQPRKWLQVMHTPNANVKKN